MMLKFAALEKMENTYFESFELNPPKFFFFYDTLIDPNQLASVLGDTEGPVTRPALIEGYSCKMYGSNPSLIDGPSPESIVHGMALEVTSPLMARKIAEHLSYSYVNIDCVMQFEDGDAEIVTGMTFKARSAF